MSQIDRSLAQAARAWPFEEARKLVARIGGKVPAKGYVLLETGYGPSGLPHIGTFGEVVRTTMVRQAFKRLSDVPTRLFCFSDDMDGLRKVPDNVPNKEVQAVMLPTLGEERQLTYSVFLPISPKTGRVLQVPVVKTDPAAGTIVYRDEDGTLVETPVTGGNVKLQWKADWAGRWFALDVD